MSDLRVVVYSQDSSLARPWLMAKETVHDLFAGRELALGNSLSEIFVHNIASQL